MTTKITIADKAINSTYTNLTGTTGGSGSGATFNVEKTDGEYKVSLLEAGTGYAPGDKITLKGTDLGGVSPANDVTVTVDAVGSQGVVALWKSTGVGRVGDGVVDVLVDVSGTTGIDTYTLGMEITDFTLDFDNGDVIATSNLLPNVSFVFDDHERIVFKDGAVAFDVLDGNAGKVYSLLSAALGANDVKPDFMGLGLSLIDSGLSEKELAQAILNTDVYKNDAGGVSTETMIKQVWKNLFGVEASFESVKAINDAMTLYGLSQADLLVFVSHMEIFQEKIDLVGLQESGIQYTPYGG